jgi:hypothetical protein
VYNSQRIITVVESKIINLESLVEELLKEAPSEEVIKTKMSALNIVYTDDPVERINRVLAALHPYELLDFED